MSVALDGAKVDLQKMYKSYHLFVTESLMEEWTTMEAEIEADFEPSLPQIIADTTLSGNIKEKKESLPNQTSSKSLTRELSELEENAIFYASGYVVHALLKSIKRLIVPPQLTLFHASLICWKDQTWI